MARQIQIIIVILLTSSLSWGQEKANHFSITERGIVWQKVFQTGLTFEELTEQIKTSGVLRAVESGSNKIYGDLKPTFANYKGAGFRFMEAPNLVLCNYYEGFAIIEFKPGKYRVTIQDIQLINRISDSTGTVNRSSLESEAIRNLEYKMTDAFRTRASFILDHTFTDRFDFSDRSNSEDW